MKRLLLIASLGLFACRAPEPREEVELEVPLPATWAAVADPSEPRAARWWESFGDEGLNAAVDEALGQNLDLRVALARVEGAAAQARIAGAERLPEVGAGGTAARGKQVFVGLPIPGEDIATSTTSSYGVSLNVSWEADLWGRLAARARAALSDFNASAQDLRALRHSLAAQTCKGWFALNEARLQLDLAERQTRSFEQNTDVVRRRYRGGLVPALDLRLTESNLAASRALTELRAEQVTRVQRQLELLLGRYPAGALESAASLPDPGATPPAGVPSELLMRRPDLRAALERIRAADDRLYDARYAFYPSLTLGLAGGRTSDTPGDLFDGDFDIWSWVLELAQPIFSGGRLAGQEELREAEVRAALEAYAGDVLRALTEVEIALAVQDQLARREAYLVVASDRARAGRLLAEDRYGSGLTDVTTVLDAQRRDLVAEGELINAQFERLQARIDLYLALGGDFELEGEPLPEATP